MEVFGFGLLLLAGLAFLILGATIVCVRQWGWWRLLGVLFLLFALAIFGWLVWWDYDERVNGNISLAIFHQMPLLNNLEP